MISERTGIAAGTLLAILMLVGMLVIYLMVTVDIGSGKAGQALDTINNIAIRGIGEKTCVDLDLNDILYPLEREAGHTDNYDGTNTPGLAQVPVPDAYAYALFFNPGSVSVDDPWDLAYWGVTCVGESGNTYILRAWNYTEIYPKKYVHIDANFLLPRDSLIDLSESLYEPQWNCTSGVKVKLVTAYTIGGGTDADVQLCYWTNWKPV